MVHRSLFIVAGVVAAVALVGCDRESSSPAAVATGPVKPYPLDVCIVSGEKLGSMGDPVVMVHEGQEVKFCCDGCTGDFKKDPAKFLAKLTAGKADHDHAGHDHAGHDHAH